MKTESRLLPPDLEWLIQLVLEYEKEPQTIEKPFNYQQKYFQLKDGLRRSIRDTLEKTALFRKHKTKLTEDEKAQKEAEEKAVELIEKKERFDEVAKKTGLPMEKIKSLVNGILKSRGGKNWVWEGDPNPGLETDPVIYWGYEDTSNQKTSLGIETEPVIFKKPEILKFRVPDSGKSWPGEDVLEGITENLLSHFIDVGRTLSGQLKDSFVKKRDESKWKKLPINTVKGTNELLAQELAVGFKGVDVAGEEKNTPSLFLVFAPGITKNLSIQATAYIFKAFGLEDGEVDKIYNRLRLRLTPKRTKVKVATK
jgi:hypothetical protein